VALLVTCTGIAGALSYWHFGNGSVDIVAGTTISAVAALASFVGVAHNQRINARSLKKVLGYFMLGGSVLIAARSMYQKPNEPQSDSVPQTTSDADASTHAVVAPPTSIEPAAPIVQLAMAEMDSSQPVARETPLQALERMYRQHSWQQIAFYVACGTVVGYMSGVLGVGGGILLLPMLALGMWRLCARAIDSVARWLIVR
jgi:uncharacterized membrane protein YfcA